MKLHPILRPIVLAEEKEKALKMKTQATPRPWYVGKSCSNREHIEIFGQNNRRIARLVSHPGDCPEVPMRDFKSSPKDLADAELIVRAVNCHDDLIEAVSTLINIVNKGCETPEDQEFILDFYEQLLKRAKGKS